MPENTDHPTQKPEKLIAKLILASSRPGDMVLEPVFWAAEQRRLSRKNWAAVLWALSASVPIAVLPKNACLPRSTTRAYKATKTAFFGNETRLFLRRQNRFPPKQKPSKPLFLGKKSRYDNRLHKSAFFHQRLPSD